MPGPKPSLTKPKARAVLNQLNQGMTLSSACEIVGVGVSSYYRRIESYPDILKEIKKVLDAEKRTRKDLAIETILDAFESDWKAAAWWLERNYPSEFGKAAPRHTQEHSEVTIRHVDAKGNQVDGLPLHLIPFADRKDIPPKNLEE